MFKADHFLTFMEERIRFIWKDEKIYSRTGKTCMIIPVFLTALLICSQFLLFKHIDTVPFVSFFCIVLFCASYGGDKGALFATLITFCGALVYYFLGIELDIITLFLYCSAGLFLTVLLHFFMQQRRQDIIQVENDQLNPELVRLEKNHEDFVDMASHELKTPVTVLKAYAQMIYLKQDKPGFADKYLNITEKMDVQLDKLLNIIGDLQDATKVKSDSLTCLMNDFNLNESLCECAEGILLSHPEVVIEYELVDPDPVIKGDKDRIEQVINNLISNALKYSGREKFIKISNSVLKEGIMVVITDHGYGISPEKIPYVFDRFYRVGSPQTKSLPGLGLGLYICREIIKLHHGEIGVTSEEGRGSEFWFFLPK